MRRAPEPPAGDVRKPDQPPERHHGRSHRLCPVLFWLAMSTDFGAPDSRVRALHRRRAVGHPGRVPGSRGQYLVTDHGEAPRSDGRQAPARGRRLSRSTSSRTGATHSTLVPWIGPLPHVGAPGHLRPRALHHGLPQLRRAAMASSSPPGGRASGRRCSRCSSSARLLLWYPLLIAGRARGLGRWGVGRSGRFFSTPGCRRRWRSLLVLALVLTVYSMLDYLWSYRRVVGVQD